MIEHTPLKGQGLKNSLEWKVERLQAIVALANEVMESQQPDDIRERYRKLIGRLREEYAEAEFLNRKVTKGLKSGEIETGDSRYGWFNTYRFAVLKAATHSRPKVNSRDFESIKSAAGVIWSDLRRALSSIKEKLDSL